MMAAAMTKLAYCEILVRGIKDKYGWAKLPEELLRVLPRAAAAMDGGDGSGNFNHAGRPSKVGGSAEGGSSNTSEDVFFGPAFKEYSGKPEQALEHLLKVKKGHVPAAIYKEGIGHIDFVYGEGGAYGYGLAHIIEQRDKEGIDGMAFVRSIPALVQKGELNRKNERFGRIYVETQKTQVVIRLDYDKEDRKWLLTSFIKKDS